MSCDFCSQYLLAYNNTIITSEDNIKAKAEENFSHILQKLKELKTEETDGSIIYSLTDVNFFNLPRYSPIPKPNVKTKWEEFAQNTLKKKKNNSGLIYDDNTGGWVRRYQKKQMQQNKNKENFVYEFKDHDDIYEDPFEKEAEEKEIKKMKQSVREMKNKFRQKGISPEDVKYVQKQKRKRESLIDNLKMAQISSSTFGRKDKKLKVEKKLKIKNKNLITKQKCKNHLIKDEISQNNKLASIVLKSL
ncbi:nuclear preribosomal assembly protein, putative [Hepatocystis sp. ex Piliocolobus tephrosceles]|nr:nuclear preribosomal assembly protein, putative [Hepatocystis sp. ex Piliocolobus tephrosceles]